MCCRDTQDRMIHTSPCVDASSCILTKLCFRVVLTSMCTIWQHVASGAMRCCTHMKQAASTARTILTCRKAGGVYRHSSSADVTIFFLHTKKPLLSPCCITSQYSDIVWENVDDALQHQRRDKPILKTFCCGCGSKCKCLVPRSGCSIAELPALAVSFYDYAV